MGVPLLNEYKRTFLFKRIPQTVLGGLKLRLGYEAPFYVYINQITLWLVPLLLGCIFTVVLELAYSNDEICEFLLLYTCLYGACIVIFVVVIQTISTVVDMKERESEEHAAAAGMAVMQKKMNLFADEDEVEFESCCGAETLTFVVPPKKFKINIAFHAILSGLVCGLGFWYLLPYTVNQLYGHNYGATVVVFLLGWLTVCITQYSLTTMAPAEPAVYRTMDTHELLPLTRPLYTFLCYTVHVANWCNSDFQVPDQILHGVFVSLPVLWLVGLLPPAEVFLLWLLEQGHVWLLGGSPAASTPRLLLNLILSTGVVVGVYFLGSTVAGVLLSALAGYLLSCDLGSLGSQVWASCYHSTNRVSTKKPSVLTQALSAPHPRNSGFLWSWCFSSVLYHLVMLLLVGATAGLAIHRAHALSDWWRPLGYGIIGLYVAEKLLRDTQSVYGGLGLWRNWFYPANVDDIRGFKAVKRKLLVLGVLRRGLLSWICPLLVVFYLGLMVGTDASDVWEHSLRAGRSQFSGMCYVLGVVRVFRWTWQSTSHALLEVSLVHAVLVAKPPGHDDLDFPVLLLVVSFGRDRFFQVANKLFFWLAVLVASWTDKKQRRSSTAPMILLNLVFFPAVLAIVVAASVLSAPLLCVFTLPLFFIGFPRLGKFWAEEVGASASTCPDTLYYRQLSSELALSLRSAFANGSLGEPHAGNHYLARFQDRLVWVMVLERGASFCTVSIKGLELQETSCHTAEAARIDDQFTEAFSVGGAGLCRFNQYPLHCLTPLDTDRVKTYSDAKNVLTGVIDAPGGVDTTLNFFVKSLVWLLLRHINKRKKEEEEARKRKEREIAEMESDSLSGGGGADWADRDRKGRKNSPPADPGRGGGLRKDKISITSGDAVLMSTSSSNAVLNLNVRPFGSKSTKKGGGSSGIVVRPPPPPFGDPSHQVMSALPPINLGNRTSLVHSQHPPRPGSGDSRHSIKSRSYSPATASLQSYTDIFSDEEECGAGDRAVLGKKFRSTAMNRVQQQHELATIVTITQDHPNPLPQSPTTAPTSLPPLFNRSSQPQGATAMTDGDTSKDMEDFLLETDFGLPAVDINIPHSKPHLGLSQSPPTLVGLHSNIERRGPESKLRPATLPAKPFSKLTVANGNHIFKPVMNLAGSPDFKCQHSSHISIPHKWRELPIEPSQLSRYISQFPTRWYQYVLGTLDWPSLGEAAKGRKLVEEIIEDDTLTNCYSQLVMACFLAFDSSGYHSGAHYLYKCYNGDVPWNAMMDWLAEDKELHSLVIKAFRFSFKLMLDQTLLGDISDGEELAECLASLEQDWYIGRETDPEWGLAVIDTRQNLFSLGYSPAQSVYTSRTLSLQDLPVAVGRVNCEVVTGQWANLNLELLYMTNDDEERYSIQAQPALLRNLTVQAADPPLGYPIYSSPPISIPTL